MPCFLSCKSRSVLAKPLEHQCSIEGNDVTWLRLELAADLATPRAVFEGLSRPSCLLNGRNVLPSLVVARAIATMQHIEDAKPRLSRCIEDLRHMKNTLVGFRDTFLAIPYLASLGNEVVIRIDHQKCGELLVVAHFHRVFLHRWYAGASSDSRS
jgi:hypothetical protein